MTHHRLPTATAAALALTCLSLLGLAACGSDAPARNGSADAPATTAGDEGGRPTGADGPVAVEHRYGTTEVPARPERIVSLDAQWTDVLVALDAPPVGYLLDHNVEGGNFPWRAAGLADSTGMRATDALPYEQIAALEPDLIVVAYFAQDQADYDRLDAIAPTIALLEDGQVDRWQTVTDVAGQVLREQDAADALIAEVDGQVDALAEELPGLEGRTYALVNFVPGDKFYVVADPEDGADDAFERLGMAISPTILDAADGVTGRAEISLEQAGLLDADLLILLTNGGEPEDIVGFDQLPAARSGAVAVLDYVDVTGLNTPSPLSLPHALDAIRPALERAAAA